MIEHVEMAKLFAKRYIPPTKKGRKSKVAEPNPNANSQNEASSSSASSSSSSNDDEGGEDGGERIKKKKRKSKKKSRSDRHPKEASAKKSKKEKEDLRIKSAMVRQRLCTSIFFSLHLNLILFLVCRGFF